MKEDLTVFGFEGTKNKTLFLLGLAQWLSWLERRPVTAEAVGSSPIWVARGRQGSAPNFFSFIILSMP